MQLTTVKTVKSEIIKIAVISALATPLSTYADGITYQDGDKYLKVGASIQLQYHQVDPDGGDTTDEIFFRRLRPYIEGSTHNDEDELFLQTQYCDNFNKPKTIGLNQNFPGS